MFNWDGRHFDVADATGDRGALVPPQFRDPMETRPSQEIGRAASGDYLSCSIKVPQRAQIKMIKMGVRKQNEMNRRQVANSKRRRGEPLRAESNWGETNSDPRK